MRRLTPLLFTLLLIGCSRAIPVEESGSTSSVSSAAIATSSAAASGAVLPPQTYTDAVGKFTVSVPRGWAVLLDDGVNTGTYEASGTSLVYAAPSPAALFLSETKVHIAVQQACPSLSASVSMSEAIDGTVFLRSSWKHEAAGGLYEGVTWMGTRGGKCYILTGELRSCTSGSGCTPADRATLLSAFERIVRSFKFGN